MEAEKNDDYPLISAIMLAGRSSLKSVLLAIKCFQAQTYPYKELIIINNAKSQFVASALNIHAQKDVFLIDTPFELSAGLSRNYGISAANGQLLAQFDPDYYHFPKRLEMQVATLAQNESHVCVLAETLQYSFVSGRASYQRNDRQAILSSMILVRPANIDYPNSEKSEEKGFLDKLKAEGRKIISMPKPDLMCKLHDCSNKNLNISSDKLSASHLKVLKNMLKDYE